MHGLSVSVRFLPVEFFLNVLVSIFHFLGFAEPVAEEITAIFSQAMHNLSMAYPVLSVILLFRRVEDAYLA